jgi:hypothetical protein
MEMTTAHREPNVAQGDFEVMRTGTPGGVYWTDCRCRFQDERSPVQLVSLASSIPASRNAPTPKSVVVVAEVGPGRSLAVWT